MLSLVSGPVPLVDARSGDPVKFQARPYWFDPLGLVGFADPEQSYYLAKLDGVCLRRRGDDTLDLRSLNIDTRLATGMSSRRAGSGVLYEFDPQTGRAIGALLGYSDPQNCGVGGRTLRFHDGTVYKRDGFDKVEFGESLEAALADHPDANEGYFSPGQSSDIVTIVSAGGYVYRYNHVSKTLASPFTGIGLANKGGWYSPELGLLITLHSLDANQDEIRVWNLDVVPEAISAPVLTAEAGKPALVETAVTGSYGEPVVDYPVSWFLTGPGELARATSNTDENGVARNEYVVPVGGDVTVQISAEVEY